MSSLLDFYSSKLFNDINRLAKPLKDHFDIDDFTYLKLTPEGHLSLTGNYAEAKISYISNLCFIKCPLFCHPDNYQNNQYIITSDWSDERFKESQSLNQKKI